MASDNKRGRSGSEPIELPSGSESDEVREQPPPKKRRTSRTVVGQLPDQLDEGEVADMSSNANSPATSNPEQLPHPALSGWNQGVKPAGLRTSFGAAVTSVTPRPVTIPTMKEESDQTQRSTKINGLAWKLPPSPKRTWGPDHTRSWQFKFESWCQDFIALNNDESHLQIIHDPSKAYQTLTGAYSTWHGSTSATRRKAALPTRLYNTQGRFPELISTIERNLARGEAMQPLALLTPDPAHTSSTENQAEKLLAAGWKVEPPVPITQSAVKKSRRRKRKEEKLAAAAAKAAAAAAGERARNEAKLAEAGRNNQRGGKGEAEAGAESASAVGDASLNPVMSSTTKEDPSQENSPSGKSSGEVSEDTGDLKGDTEMEDANNEAYRERYYPGISADQVFCTSCASFGHGRHSCPEAKCRFCGHTEHMAPGCPTRQRCSKCKQLGHIKDNCREKLALAPGEGMECAFCASKEHTESDCTEFYRTYRPSEQTTQKVKQILIFCYCCGNEGHYGTLCGLNPPATKTASIEIWSKANWQHYVDAKSAQDAIAWDSTLVAGAYANDASGRPDLGKSIVPTRHVIFEDDDDDADEGFIRPPVQRERQNGQIHVGRQGRGGYSSLAQQANNPPLPPGPPPGLPARPPQPNGKRSKKPKPFQQNQRHGQQNGQGGGGFRIRGGANRGRGGRR